MKSIHWCNLALSDSLLSFFIKVRLCLILFWSLLLHHKHFKHFSSYYFIILIMSSRKSKSNRRWLMYLTLHDDVSRLLEENDLHFNFQENNDIESCTKEYDINIISQFRCHNCACDSNEWSSKRITIIIWMYSEAQYNAKVYHQRCLRCNNFSKSHLDDSYAEKVTYHLKKWCKMKMNRFFIQIKVKILIWVIYVRNARMIIAVNCDRDDLINETSQLFTFNKKLISNCYSVIYMISCWHSFIISIDVLVLDLLVLLVINIQKI